MDIGSIAGLLLVILAIMGSIMYGGSILLFVDVPSILVVGFGCVGVSAMKWPPVTWKKLVPALQKFLVVKDLDPKAMIDKIQELAEMARRESVFALEKAEIDDPFLKKASTLAADNRPPDVIKGILQLEIDAMGDRHKVAIQVMDGLADDGPAMGMIGTLIGLVQMLQNLSDPSAIGPAMAVALLTTFYGSVIANTIANPIKNKLEANSKREIATMSIVIAGILGIVAGENPKVIREKLDSFLPPEQRNVEVAAE
jgi:chemotaxis protein MotA